MKDSVSEMSSSSLLQKSVGKLGSISQPSLSFSSDTPEGSKIISNSPEANYGTGKDPNCNSSASPSMAQLRARSIMSEARKMNSYCANKQLTSPSTEGSDWEEASTDISSNADLETVSNVSKFIDSLQNQGIRNELRQISSTRDDIAPLVPPLTLDVPTSQSRAENNMRYQSSLANARHAMAASPIATSFAPVGDLTPRINLVDHDSDTSRSQDLSTVRPELSKAHSQSILPAAPEKYNQENLKAEEDDKQMCTSQTVRKNVHYYALLTQIQKIVRSDDASLSLGKVLADANKRGISLDVVTEIYKRERSKARLEKTSCQNIAVNEMESGRASNTLRENTSIKTEPCRIPSEHLSLIVDEVARGHHSPIVTQTQDLETSISGEIADDMKELSRLCDQATAFYSENEKDNSLELDGSSQGGKTADDLDGRAKIKNPPGSRTSRAASNTSRPSLNRELRDDGISNESELPMNDSQVKSHNKCLTCVSTNISTTENKEQAGIYCAGQIPAADDEFNSGSRSPLDGEKERCVPGLNDVQLKQLVKKAEELQGVDPKLGFTEVSGSLLIKAGCEEEGTSSIGEAEDIEAIDAFFSRFSIQKEEGLTHKLSKETSPSDYAGSGGLKEISENLLNMNNFFGLELSDMPIANTDDGITSQGETGEMRAIGVNGPVWPAKDAATLDMLKNVNKKYLSSDANNPLPKHLGLWKSPWNRKCLTHTHNLDFPPGGSSPKTGCYGQLRHCLLSLDQCTNGHTGYFNVDFYSLYEATVVQAEDEDIDQAPWEYRDVGQRFLHEKSVEARNWFGSFEIQRGNDRVPNPVCRPKSIEVSVTKIPEPGEWSEDWFTTWKSRKDNPNNLVSFAHDEYLIRGPGLPPAKGINSQQAKSCSTKKVVVEIGSLCPVRVKGSERVSRIHPKFTSSLRRSRWRKKYLKGSMFPTD